MLQALEVSMACVDADGVIVDVNEGWRRFGESNGLAWSDHGLGRNYLDICSAALGREHRLVSDLRRLLSGETQFATWAYDCHAPDRKRWCTMLAFAGWEGAQRAAILHIEITRFISANPKADEVELAQAFLVPFAYELVNTSLPSRRAAEPTRRPSEFAALSPRQREVFALLGLGLSNAEISSRLDISVNTAKIHVAEVIKRMNFASRAHAALRAAELYGRPGKGE